MFYRFILVGGVVDVAELDLRLRYPMRVVPRVPVRNEVGNSPRYLAECLSELLSAGKVCERRCRAVGRHLVIRGNVRDVAEPDLRLRHPVRVILPPFMRADCAEQLITGGNDRSLLGRTQFGERSRPLQDDILNRSKHLPVRSGRSDAACSKHGVQFRFHRNYALIQGRYALRVLCPRPVEPFGGQYVGG